MINAWQIRSSHVDHKVNDEFLVWLEIIYVEDRIGKVKATRGKEHDYLEIKLVYTTDGKLKV